MWAPDGIYVGPGYHHHHYYRDHCRVIVDHHTNRYGEDVAVRRRICEGRSIQIGLSASAVLSKGRRLNTLTHFHLACADVPATGLFRMR